MTYSEFWHGYLTAHAKPATRLLHYAGSVMVVGAVVLAVVVDDWRWLIAAPVVGYGFAWGAHLLVEGNTPKTFGHPLWSLVSDYRMLFLWLTFRLAPHLAAARATSAAQASGSHR